MASWGRAPEVVPGSERGTEGPCWDHPGAGWETGSWDQVSRASVLGNRTANIHGHVHPGEGNCRVQDHFPYGCSYHCVLTGRIRDGDGSTENQDQGELENRSASATRIK